MESSKEFCFERKMSCLLFQIVNMIPVSRHMPKWGAGEVYDQTLPADLGPEGQSRQGASLTKGQILWLRGITRLQTQVCIKKRIRLSMVLVSNLKMNCFLTFFNQKKSCIYKDIYYCSFLFLLLICLSVSLSSP